MDTSEKMFISFFVVLIVGLIVLNLVLFFNNKNTSVGGKQTYTCKDGTTFTCYAGTEGCMDNSPMHCPTPVDVVGNCCNKDGTPDGKCNFTKDKCTLDKGCKWKVGPCQCNLEHGTCGTKSCVGGGRFCGLNLNLPSGTKATQPDCDKKLNEMGGKFSNFVSCDPGYNPTLSPVQTNCQFSCEKSN